MSGEVVRVTSFWFACSVPERPTDPFVLWHYHDCTGCRVKAEVLAHLHPDNPHVAWLNKQMGVAA